MTFITEIKTFAALGSGVIGSGWVSRALAHGLDVVAWDPAPGAEAALRKRVANAWPALEQKGLAAGASQDRLRFVPTIEECVRDADFIQESAPERLDLKLDLHSKISAAAKPNAIIGSSTSGLLPSEFYESAAHPERCVVGHPFNPVYLLPLVEVVGGKNTAPEAIEAAITDLEGSIKSGDKADIDNKTAALTTAAQKLGEKMYADMQAQQAGGGQADRGDGALELPREHQPEDLLEIGGLHVGEGASGGDHQASAGHVSPTPHVDHLVLGPVPGWGTRSLGQEDHPGAVPREGLEELHLLVEGLLEHEVVVGGRAW